MFTLGFTWWDLTNYHLMYRPRQLLSSWVWTENRVWFSERRELKIDNRIQLCKKKLHLIAQISARIIISFLQNIITSKCDFALLQLLVPCQMNLSDHQCVIDFNAACRKKSEYQLSGMTPIQTELVTRMWWYDSTRAETSSWSTYVWMATNESECYIIMTYIIASYNMLTPS